MRNEMLLRRKNMVIIEGFIQSEDKTDGIEQYIATSMKKIEYYGFTYSDEIIEKLEHMSKSDVVNFHKIIEELLKTINGNDCYSPMYINFPTEVMEMEESELYINAIIHYISLGTFLPNQELEERFPLIHNGKLTKLRLGTIDDFNDIFTNLLSSKAGMSNEDKEDIKWFIHNYNIKNIMPKEILFKETLSFVTNELWENKDMRELLIPYYKTATDVLRLAVSLSGMDESLVEYPTFKSFKRAERKLLLRMLEKCNNIEEDMLRYKVLWIRLGEILHPGEYKQFIKVNKAFKKIRNNEKIETFSSKIEKAFDQKDLDSVIELLSKRPGEFARRLGRVFKLAYVEGNIGKTKENSIKVIESFSLIAEEINTKLLLNLINYFNGRKEDSEYRVFIPKGNIAKAYGKEETMKRLDLYVCNSIITICKLRLMNDYSKRGYLGNVYVDESLKDYTVPMTQRNATKSLKSVARGTKFKIEENTKVIRPFIYWKDASNNGWFDGTDLDLSFVAYDENFKTVSYVSYFNLRDSGVACHSGDIVSAPNGASEFIDIDIEKIKLKRGKYVAIVVNSFSGEPFCDLPECFAGFMERDGIQTGEIYEPKTVKNKSDLTSNSSKMVIPMIIDIDSMKCIWADLSISSNEGISNIASNNNSILHGLKSVLETNRPNLYDLFTLHAVSRGDLVENKEEADTIFSLEEGITPYDTDTIVGKFL